MKLSRAVAVATATTFLLGAGSLGAVAVEPPQTRSELLAVEGDPVDVGVTATDAPRAIRIGAVSTVVPITVITGEPVDALEAGVVSPEEVVVGLGLAEAAEPGRPRVFKPQVEVRADVLTSWGEHAWVFVGATEDQQTVATGVAVTEVKAHSMLGLATSGQASSLRVTGSLRAYNSVRDGYVAWAGQGVSVQRLDGNRWVQVRGATTDARGNVATTVSVPAGSKLRLVVKDGERIWGGVSRTAAV